MTEQRRGGLLRVLRAVGMALLVASVVWLLSWLTDSRAMLAAVGVVLGIGLIRGLDPMPDGLRITTDTMLRTRTGEPVTQTVYLDNVSGRRTRGCTVELTTPGLTDTRFWCPALNPGEVAVCEVERVGTARGTADHAPVTAVTWMPFGQRQWRNMGHLRSRTVVHPPPAPPTPLRKLAVTSEARALRRGGTDVTGVRRWTPGDSQRAVHWRATARQGELVVAERGEPEGATVRALVIGDHFDQHGDDALARLAATAVTALRTGQAVRIGWWRPGEGLRSAPTHSVLALLDWFAAIGGPAAPATAATPVHDPRSDLIGFLDGDNPLTVVGREMAPGSLAFLRDILRPLDVHTGGAAP